jgi:hypothetical protein
MAAIQLEEGDPQGREFALPKPGQYRRLVKQRSFTPKQTVSLLNFRSHVSGPGPHRRLGRAVRPPPAGVGHCVTQGPFPRGGEQLLQFGRGERPALTHGLALRLRHVFKRVVGKPPLPLEPVGEGVSRRPVNHLGAGSDGQTPHLAGPLRHLRQITVEPVGGQVAELLDARSARKISLRMRSFSCM